jgi:hypothetical protein
MALYTVIFDRVTVTAIQDLFEVNTATDSVTIIHAVELSQTSEIGDVQEEMLPLIFKRANPGSTSGSGGTVPVSISLETGSSAYGGTTEVNNTTRMVAGTGSINVLRVDAWNVRTGYLWLPTPEMRPILGINSRFGVELPVAPADAITMSGTLTFEELGG